MCVSMYLMMRGADAISGKHRSFDAGGKTTTYFPRIRHEVGAFKHRSHLNAWSVNTIILRLRDHTPRDGEESGENGEEPQ